MCYLLWGYVPTVLNETERNHYPFSSFSTKSRKSRACGITNWAEDGTRTRYLQLGKLSLYQVSYFRLLSDKILKFIKSLLKEHAIYRLGSAWGGLPDELVPLICYEITGFLNWIFLLSQLSLMGMIQRFSSSSLVWIVLLKYNVSASMKWFSAA